MKYLGSCHCGEVEWSLDGEIESVTACNCTTCRRYGGLWAYGYKDENISVSGPTSEYARGDKELGFHFCSNCGCMAYWLARSPNSEDKFRIAVNTRLIDEPNQIQRIPIRHFEGLDKFEELPKDNRCVKDVWF